MERTIRIDDRDYAMSSDDNYLKNMGKSFEPDMVRLFKCLIQPGMLIADIGANIGMTSFLFSQLGTEVHAFEPSPSTFKILEHNVNANSVTNVELFNIGMGDRHLHRTLTYSGDNRSGAFVSEKERPQAGHVTEAIEITTLDSFYWCRNRRPQFVKVDVEGFEPRVLEGGRNFFASEKPIAVLELNHFCLQVLQRYPIPDYFDLLREIFPVLIAVQRENASFVDLHNRDAAYSVMHEHVLHFDFPNIVAGFDPAIGSRLVALQNTIR